MMPEAGCVARKDAKAQFFVAVQQVIDIIVMSLRVSALGGCIEKLVLSLTKCRHYVIEIHACLSSRYDSFRGELTS